MCFSHWQVQLIDESRNSDSIVLFCWYLSRPAISSLFFSKKKLKAYLFINNNAISQYSDDTNINVGTC